MEFFDWAFIVTIIGWVIREVWASVSRDTTIKKQANIEHEYYRKRLIFEHKHEFYKDVYHKLREYQGALVAFDRSRIKRTLTTVQLDAKENYIDYLKEEGKNENFIKKFEELYSSNLLYRVDANYDMTMQKIEDSRSNLQNFLSVNKFMLNEEEDEIIRSFYKLSEQMEIFISKSEPILEDTHPVQRYQKLVNHFNNLYNEAFKLSDILVDDFEKCIRKSIF